MLIVLYSTFSTPAIAFTLAPEEDTSEFRSSENLQSNHSNRSLFFQEFSADLSPEITRYFPVDLGFLSKFKEPGFFSDKSFEEFASWVYLQDKKSLIKNQIFPFHIFW
ncbi:hypothetical protein [Autumnicola psychrophila]|uniref:Uncharacterized protein n=1 Tax=Autumnicola psychrophila TaxID=3075592 RepID=A0ABU3DQS5_9FLAO|nr:hypothetical protein [Zunongwangia sp. F225]MDT0685452.1 hypothetical protein [Zunongwangia sp. F225]